MAYPLIPTAPLPTAGFVDDSGDESSDGEEDLTPKFDLVSLNDTDDDDDTDEEGDEDESETAGFALGELNSLMNLGKPTAAFPFSTTTQRVQAQPAAHIPKPVVPFPGVAQTTLTLPQPTFQLPQPAGLRLTILPTTIPQVPTTIPQISTAIPQVPTTIPQIPTAIPQVPTTIPQVPTAIPQVPTAIPQVPAVVPQITGLTLAPKLAGIPQITGLNVPMAPNVVQVAKIPPVPATLTLTPTPQLPPLTTAATPKVTALPGQGVSKTVDVATILAKMPGITVAGVTPAPAQVQADINDLFHKEEDETDDDFEARRRLTIKLASIPDYKLNNETAMVAGNIMMKKAKLGVSYDPDVEAAITYLAALLQR
ncbi:Hypothetical protein HVR_LOCUS1282 [uncultured virus]|nr:Hypothetical protein HVR_LOCUS1282 [uncultured virus]